jgi:hypothetical protein
LDIPTKKLGKNYVEIPKENKSDEEIKKIVKELKQKYDSFNG